MVKIAVVGDGEGRASGRGAAAAALPCRNSNNSIHQALQEPTSFDRKRAFVLRKNVAGFIDYWGREHALFFTLTDAGGMHPKDFAQRWDSWKTNCGDWLAGYLKVLEPQKSGRPHYHNLAAVEFDTRPDEFDWDAFDQAAAAYQAKDWAAFRIARARYVASAAPELRLLWARTRAEMPLYGLGRCEILPIRKAGAIAEYVGKYLDKGQHYRPASWKGVRRTELDRRTSKNWRMATTNLSWVSPGGRLWRSRVRQLALALGLPDNGDVSGITKRLGSRWAYQLRGDITTGSDTEWSDTLQAILHVAGVNRLIPAAVEYDNGRNSAW